MKKCCLRWTLTADPANPSRLKQGYFIYVYLCLPTNTYVYLRVPTWTYVYLRVPTCTNVYLCVSTWIYVYLRVTKLIQYITMLNHMLTELTEKLNQR